MPVLHPASKGAQWKTTSLLYTLRYIYEVLTRGPLVCLSCRFATQTSNFTVSQTLSKQDSPECQATVWPWVMELLHHGRGDCQSCLSWLARWTWALFQVAAIQLLLLERETWADHYRAAPRQILEELWQQGMPGTAVLFQRKEQLERGHRAGIALHRPYPPAYMVVLKVDEERAPP